MLCLCWPGLWQNWADHHSGIVQTQSSGWEDFNWFQLTVQIRAWGLKRKMHWDRSKPEEHFFLREVTVSSDPRSAPKTAKKPFFLKSHLTRWLLSLGRGSQLGTELILEEAANFWYWADTSWYKLTLSWHWTAFLWCPAGGGWWHLALILYV